MNKPAEKKPTPKKRVRVIAGKRGCRTCDYFD
jgi:hypothetical protein